LVRLYQPPAFLPFSMAKSRPAVQVGLEAHYDIGRRFSKHKSVPSQQRRFTSAAQKRFSRFGGLR
jgi:hypothetical protein